MLGNEKQYKLVNLNNGNIIVLDGKDDNVEPRNWEDSDYTFKKSTKNLSETRTYSKNLEFTMNGAKFLRDAYLIDDVEAKVQMFEIRFHPLTSVPYDYFIGDFDFSTYKDEQLFVSVAFDAGGANQIIKTKGKNKFELERTTDINGNEIPELEYNTYVGENRPLFLNSLAETLEEENSSSVFRMRQQDDYFYGFFSIPMGLIFESDDSFSGVPNDLFGIVRAEKIQNNFLKFDVLRNNRLQLYYYNSDRDKNLNLNIDVDMLGRWLRANNLTNNFCELALIKFKGGENPEFAVPDGTIKDGTELNNLDDYTRLLQLNDLAIGGYNFTKQITYNNTININLLKGESLGLFIVGGGDFEQTFDFATLDLNFENIKASVNIQENSLITDIPRQASFLFNKKVGERLSNILFGEIKYKSNFFSNSDFKLTGLTSGKKIRGFEDSKITTSWNDFEKNSASVFGMGWNIEYINGKETIVHEDLKHFFRNETVIVIPTQVNKVKRKPATDFIYSDISVGYKKPSSENLYEEVQGLNEYNVENKFITPIKSIEKELDLVSPYRADSEGKELTARQHKKFNPTTDYRTDNDIFNLDLKETETDIYKERIYSDDFDSLPEGVFSPETCTGLRLTPSAILKRNAWYFNNAFTKFTSKFIRYASSIGNTDLITVKDGEATKEDQDFQINKLENPIFVSQWIEFEYPLNFELLDQVNGSTLVNGELIPNTYFKVEFINEFNQKEYGYLFELKPNKEGKWKLLKAF